MPGFDHPDVTVDDVDRAAAQFDPVMSALGFARQAAGWSVVREPKEYRRFTDRYYASFVEDDNGIRIEFMHNPPHVGSVTGAGFVAWRGRGAAAADVVWSCSACHTSASVVSHVRRLSTNEETDMVKKQIDMVTQGIDLVTEGIDKAKKTNLQVPLAAKVGLGLLGVIQVAFAFLAFWDIAWRDADDVRGPKPAWIPVILVNWIGPAAYFLAGIRHRR